MSDSIREAFLQDLKLGKFNNDLYRCIAYCDSQQMSIGDTLEGIIPYIKEIARERGVMVGIIGDEKYIIVKPGEEKLTE